VAVLGAMLVAGPALGALAEGHLGSSQAAPRGGRTQHLVRPGETLWEIARGLVGPEGDPRPVIEAIRDANGLEAAPLLAGDTLVLPRS
jgi:Tfp pilus assembly protein FimV